MRCNFRIYLLSGLVALLFSCFANAAHAYGMECDKPAFAATAGVPTAFSFNCRNTTSGAHFASYEIFPVCTDKSSPLGICNSVVFTATGCPYSIAPGAVCKVQGSFMPGNTGTYVLDFNDRYGSVTYTNIFCNDPSKGCIIASATTPFAYVTPSAITPGNSTIDKCAVDAGTGELLSCSTAYDGNDNSNSPPIYTKLTFAVVGGVQYAFATDQNKGVVYQFTINADENLDLSATNSPTLNPTGWSPSAITFATIAGVQYAYVTDVNGGYIYQCSLDPSRNPADGFFTSCTANTNISFAAPYSIDVETVGGQQYAYVTDAGVGGTDQFGNVYQCTLDQNNGSLLSCKPTLTSADTPKWIPYGIDFATVNGVQYAYVADNGIPNTPQHPATGRMYQCTLTDENDGLFKQCTPQNAVAPTNGWNPSAITFATLSGTPYGYVPSYQGTSSGNMYSCTLNNDGSFSKCPPTPNQPPSIWAPTSIAFRFN
jgi:hypothetical protein